MTLLVIIMLVAGVGGGVVNIALAQNNQVDKGTNWKSIATGVGAAFLMPLFLNTMSSSLLKSIFEQESIAIVETLVFGAFCLLATNPQRFSIRRTILSLARLQHRFGEAIHRDLEKITSSY